MKKFLLHSSLLMILFGSTLVSCHSELDLTNIDTTSELEMGMALPVGTVNTCLRDFIGQIPHLYVDSMPGENKGVIVWENMFQVKRQYFKQEVLPKSFSAQQFSFPVYEQMEAVGMIGPNGRITADNQPRTLVFDLPFKLKGVNTDLVNCRLDSIQLNEANFVSVITRENLPLEWEWLDQVELRFGEQVVYEGKRNNSKVVYTKGQSGSYGSSIPSEIKHFSVDLMKDHSNPNAENNVVNTVALQVAMTFTVPEMAAEFPIEQNAKVNYSLAMKDVDFLAAWGYFIPSGQMSDEHVEDLSGDWGDLGFLKTARLPFAKPTIDVEVRTEVAGALRLIGNYLYTTDYNDKRQYATFLEDGKVSQSHIFTHKDYEAYLDPYTSTPGDVTDKIWLHYDETPELGHVDSLFQFMPKEFAYSFSVDVDTKETPQARLTKNDTVHALAHCKLPLIFNQGVFISYTDTIKDIAIGQLSIDSLVKNVNNSTTAIHIDTVKTSDVKVILRAQNNIQFGVRVAFRCLDEGGIIIPDPEDISKDFLLFPEDTIRIPGPTFQSMSNTWTPVAPGESIITAALSKQQLEVFPKIKSILYTVIIDDESIQEAYKKGLLHIRIKADDLLKFKIGLTAQADALLNFNGQNNNK